MSRGCRLQQGQWHGVVPVPPLPRASRERTDWLTEGQVCQTRPPVLSRWSTASVLLRMVFISFKEFKYCRLLQSEITSIIPRRSGGAGQCDGSSLTSKIRHVECFCMSIRQTPAALKISELDHTQIWICQSFVSAVPSCVVSRCHSGLLSAACLIPRGKNERLQRKNPSKHVASRPPLSHPLQISRGMSFSWSCKSQIRLHVIKCMLNGAAV